MYKHNNEPEESNFRIKDQYTPYIFFTIILYSVSYGMILITCTFVCNHNLMRVLVSFDAIFHARQPHNYMQKSRLYVMEISQCHSTHRRLVVADDNAGKS